MTAQEIRKNYLKFFEARKHKVIPRALLVPQNDPTTLFTGSGMQPLIPYLLGEEHPDGRRLVNSQTCLRAQDIDEVGDNRHTTFFEMLGNWSLGDYFKPEQLPWFWEFLTKEVGLDPKKLYTTCYIGHEKFKIPKDTESAKMWQQLFNDKKIEAGVADLGSIEEASKRGIKSGERIFFYSGKPNWWCRNGKIEDMPSGEPGGPSSEVFYEFDFVPHTPEYGDNCHPNCDCGHFLEIGNSVFMEYVRGEKGFEKLPKKNVDFGAGLERIAAAKLNSPDMFKISVIWPIIEKLQTISGKDYDSHTESMRVIADHLRAATFLAVDGVVPSNKEQGYVMRRLLRRAIRFAFELGVEQNFLEEIVPTIIEIYHKDFPEVSGKRGQLIDVLVKEEKAFRLTLRKGLRELEKQLGAIKNLEEADQIQIGKLAFLLHDTYGFPIDLTEEEMRIRGVWLATDSTTKKGWRHYFETEMQQQRDRSRTATKGEFKGGLGGHSDIHKKYHTATHLMYQALRDVLGNHIVQHGSNITEERLRFDFSHPKKMTPEEIEKVEDIVNEQIANDLVVTWEEHPTNEAINKLHVLGAFGDRYGEIVKVYRMQAKDATEPFSFEICGGPHVEHTGQLADNHKKFKIIKEESSSAGIRRIKAVLQ